ncbi:unnamed protein product [Gulo gulo]|uniref:Uncharacterized protein n=1 Tax=Gulo gulo TaxID=48420 RepID=A0A9X9LHP2_GULGU|nr:unnamed protein product [Gulo gulo]
MLHLTHIRYQEKLTTYTMAEWEEGKLLLPCFKLGMPFGHAWVALHTRIFRRGERNRMELGGDELLMLRRGTLTQKSRLKKNRTYFSNFKPLMPMLGYSYPKK